MTDSRSASDSDVPLPPEGLAAQAEELWSSQRYDQAVGIYARLVHTSPEDAALRLRYAEVCRHTGRMREAIQSYRVAAKLFVKERTTAEPTRVVPAPFTPEGSDHERTEPFVPVFDVDVDVEAEAESPKSLAEEIDAAIAALTPKPRRR